MENGGMETAASEPAEIDWVAVTTVITDVALPVLAILVPTVIAILLFRAERRDARASAAQARRMDAAAEVILALAPMASIQPYEPMQEKLWHLRARIAVYRTWLDLDDLSGDWLALRHREGMSEWSKAMEDLNAQGGPNRLLGDELAELLRPSHTWAAETLEMLSAWMRGHLPVTRLQSDGARIIEKYGPPPQADA